MISTLVAVILSQAHGVNGPVEGTQCSGVDSCKVSGLSCTTDGSGESSWPAPKEGPACGCVKGVCHFVWIEPVACKRDTDCELRLEPVAHAVKATKKQKRLRPCIDGSRQAQCEPETKTCVVRAWKC